jgi:hypothetical protein
VQERAKLLRMYGPELFQEEAAAVEGMFRMLNYQQGITSSAEEGGFAEGKDGANGDEMSNNDFEAMVRALGAASAGGAQGGDIYLPPFVRKALEEMLSATDKEGKSFTDNILGCCTRLRHSPLYPRRM